MENEIQRLKKEVDSLKSQIGELTAFMKQKKDQQLSFPLDYSTQEIIQVNALRQRGAWVTGSAAVNGYLPVVVNNVLYKVQTRA